LSKLSYREGTLEEDAKKDPESDPTAEIAPYLIALDVLWMDVDEHTCFCDRRLAEHLTDFVPCGVS
jgi:hypothetical protein